MDKRGFGAPQEIWFAYNHMPNGQIVVSHFKDEQRTRRGSQGEEDIFFSAKDQIEAFKKGDQVVLNVKGKIIKNEILIYKGPSDLMRIKDPASEVIRWVKEQGMQPIESQNDKAKPHETQTRLDALEGRVDTMGHDISKILDLLQPKEKPELARSKA